MADETTIDDIFDVYEKLMSQWKPDQFSSPDFLFMSIDSLQSLRPEFTDEVLTEAGCIRGIHLVAIVKGEIMFVTPEECP